MLWGRQDPACFNRLFGGESAVPTGLRRVAVSERDGSSCDTSRSGDRGTRKLRPCQPRRDRVALMRGHAGETVT